MTNILQPSGILKNYIQNYFIVETNNEADFIPRQRVFPYGNVTIVFHYGSPSKFKKRNSVEHIESNLVICGQQTSYYDLSLSGKTGMILIVFKPHGIKPFFDIPISEFSNENLSLHEIINHEAVELEDKLHNSYNNKQRIIIIENFLMKKLMHDKDFERVEHAVKKIKMFKGQLKSNEIAQEVCLGIKQFERIFSKHVGLNPKKYSSIIRFQNILNAKRINKELTMQQLAFDNGYFDHSHFIHDFKSLTGLSPRNFFTENEK